MEGVHDFLSASPGIWGLAGVLIYAAPRFLVCMREQAMSGNGCRTCAFDGFIAVVVAVSAALSFTPWISDYLHATKDHDTRALASVIGLLANPLGPRLVKVFGDGTVNAIRKWLPGKDDSNE